MVLDSLADGSRREVLDLVRRKPSSVQEIADQLPISRPAVSKHLRILENAGLVEYRSSGTRNIFRLKAEGFATARAYLASFWDEALANFQRVAEEP